MTDDAPDTDDRNASNLLQGVEHAVSPGEARRIVAENARDAPTDADLEPLVDAELTVGEFLQHARREGIRLMSTTQREKRQYDAE